MNENEEDVKKESEDEHTPVPHEQEEEQIDLSQRRVPKIIISGGPASGKGTQCDFIVKEWNVVHLSSGDMLRMAVESGSEEGRRAQEFMNSGKLVPDELIINIVADRVSQRDCLERGFVLDGFPRTAVQVHALIAAGVHCDVFLQIDVDDEVIVQRVAGRRMDPKTGKIYHLKYLPPPDDIVHRLQQRSDDTEEKIKTRLATYHSNVAGIINNFKHCTVAVNTNGKNPQQIWREFRHKMKLFLKFHVVFLLGAPSSGKSMLSHNLADVCEGYKCITVPDLMTDEISCASDNGVLIQKLLDEGKEIPIDIIIKCISKRMFEVFESPAKSSKIIIDGFPLSDENFTKWYEAMGQCTAVDYFLNINTPADILQNRLECKLSAESAKELVTTYHKATIPLLSTLEFTGKLRNLDGVLPPKVLLKEATTLISGLNLIAPLERTFAMVKPDAVADGKAHEIHKAIVADGRLTVVASKLVQLDSKAVDELYAEDLKNSPAKNKVKSFLTSGPSLCLVLEGLDAIQVWRSMMGPCDPIVATKNAPYTLRALYGSDVCRNAVHGSSTEGKAMSEINFFLSPTGSGQRLVSVLGAKADLNPLKSDCFSSLSGSVKSSGGLMVEDTCAVLKPLTADIHYDDILAVVRSQGFEIVSEIKTHVTAERIREFYSEHKDKEFFEQLIAFMLSRQIVALRLRRVGAVKAWRCLMGLAELDKSRIESPDSLRTLFAIDSIRNAVGGSDSLQSAQREIAHYFSYGSDLKNNGCGSEEGLLQSPSKKALPPILGSPLSPSPLEKKHRSPYELKPISRSDIMAMNSYNEAEIHPVLGPVITKLIVHRPKNVKEFILQELQSEKQN